MMLLIIHEFVATLNKIQAHVSQGDTVELVTVLEYLLLCEWFVLLIYSKSVFEVKIERIVIKFKKVRSLNLTHMQTKVIIDVIFGKFEMVSATTEFFT